jgi:hypothetical protein
MLRAFSIESVLLNVCQLECSLITSIVYSVILPHPPLQGNE